MKALFKISSSAKDYQGDISRAERSAVTFRARAYFNLPDGAPLKNFGPAALLSALGFMLFACSGRPLPETLKISPQAKDYGVPFPAPAERVWTVAVLEFEDHTVGTEGAQGIARVVTDRVVEALAGRPDLRLIERESLHKVLEELSLSSRNLAAPESQLTLGKLLGAQYLITGGITAVGNAVRMDGRIIDVEKGGVDGTSLQGTWDRRIALEQAFSKQMADRLVAKIGTPETGPQTGGGYFLRGTAFERADNPTKALEMYQKALSLDPQNQAARDRMESLLLKELQ